MDRLLFEGLTQESADQGRAMARINEYFQDQKLENSSAVGIHLILRGRARITTISRSGREVLISQVESGDLLVGEGLSGFAGESSWRHFTVSSGCCQVMTFSPECIKDFCEQQPLFAANLRQALAFSAIMRERRIARLEEDKNRLYELVAIRDQQLTSSQQDLMRLPFFARNRKRIEDLARQRLPIIISGEKGVGKHRLARLLNDYTPVPGRIFMSVDFYNPATCQPAGEKISPRELLFGSGRESDQRTGLIDYVREGTLVINGFETLDEQLQKTLWQRALQEAEGAESNEASFRLIILTRGISCSDDQAGGIASEIMNSDKLRSLEIPPLRKRKRDIPPLLDFYLDLFNRELGKEVTDISDEARKELLGNLWWGNESELMETLRRGVILAERGFLQAHHITSGFQKVESSGKYNLLKRPFLQGLLAHPFFPLALQWAAAPFFFILLFILLFGPNDPEINIGSAFIWGWGWPIMVIGAFLWARFWCSICPIGSTSAWMGKLYCRNLSLPDWLEKYSDLLLTIIIITIIWSELVWNLRDHPFRLGLLLTTILSLALFFGLLFERQVWCSFLCGLGGMIGLFAKVAFIELRADRNICLTSCSDHECFAGGESGDGCPLFRYAPSLVSNQRCRLCMNCLKNCRHGSISLFLRSPGRELWETPPNRPWAAFFIFAIMGSLILELNLDSSLWNHFESWLVGGRMTAITAAMLTLVLGCNLLLGLISWFQKGVSGQAAATSFANYGLSYLPLAVGAYFAFHFYYFIVLGGRIPGLIADYGHLEVISHFNYSLPAVVLHNLQKFFLGLGLVGSLIVLLKITSREKLSRNRKIILASIHCLLLGGLSLIFFFGICRHFASA